MYTLEEIYGGEYTLTREYMLENGVSLEYLVDNWDTIDLDREEKFDEICRHLGCDIFCVLEAELAGAPSNDDWDDKLGAIVYNYMAEEMGLYEVQNQRDKALKEVKKWQQIAGLLCVIGTILYVYT